MPEAIQRGTADHRLALKLVGGILLGWLVALALVLAAARLPPEASGTVIAVFPSRMDAVESLAAAGNAGARLVSASAFENVLVLADDAPGLAGRLEHAGALAVFRNVSLAGVSFAGCIGADIR